MFTVCPKCALTLVVTAADLRVAQGYVRCGRCSNVFNALARLSEDRNAAAAAAASQGVPPSSTGVHPRPQPTAVPSPPSQPSPTPARPPAGDRVVYLQSLAGHARANSAHAAAAARCAAYPATTGCGSAARRIAVSLVAARATAPSSGRYDDDDGIPEDALEFNPDAADVNQVFVEPPPNPEWTAATGTFKAIVLKSEEVFRGPPPSPPPPGPATTGGANRAGAGLRARWTRLPLISAQ